MTNRVNPAWLESNEHAETATCFVCVNLMQEPYSCCPEGHSACRSCLVRCLSRKKECPQCRHVTDESKCHPSRDPKRLRPLSAARHYLAFACTSQPLYPLSAESLLTESVPAQAGEEPPC